MNLPAFHVIELSAHLKESCEANRLRRQREEETEVGDLNIGDLVATWASSAKRENMHHELEVSCFIIFSFE